MYAARNASKYGLPVFPVNLGEFGFIASVQPDEWKRELNVFLEGKAVFASPERLENAILVDRVVGRHILAFSEYRQAIKSLVIARNFDINRELLASKPIVRLVEISPQKAPNVFCHGSNGLPVI